MDTVGDRLYDTGVGMTQDHGAPGAHIVDVSVAVGVEKIGSCGVLEEKRIPADSAKRPYRRVDTTRDVALRGSE
jgi:hypothetical protein